MRTTDLFKNNRAPKKLNETIEKTFGIKLNLESFTVEQLEDARNKLRTQIYTARNESSFNETVENDTLTQAQWMHDAIVSELTVRQEHIVDNTQIEEGSDFDEKQIIDILRRFESNMNEIGGYADLDYNKIISMLRDGDVEGAVEAVSYEIADQDGGEVNGIEPYLSDLEDDFDYIVNGSGDDEGGETDDAYALASAGFGSDEDYGDFDQNESAPPTAKGERMVKHIKKGYADDGKLTDKEKSIAYATAWKQHNKDKNESIETGEDMTRLQEGEIQQASAIVTAKTMVDRVGRWIEELSGMENDTLLQLGDSIRDEMSQDLAKNFISTVAPAIQQALQNLKDTRETLASGVRTLTGEEQPAEMLGAEPGSEMGMGGEEGGLEAGPAAPDEMNAEVPGDDFGAAEPAVGGDTAAGRAQRESIQYQSNLLKVLAG
jgi:hypothetical protein